LEERVGERRPITFSTLWFLATFQWAAAPIVRLKGHDGLLSLPLSSKGGEGKDAAALRLDALLFGEAQGRVIISVAGVDAVKVLAQAKILGITATRLGTVGGGVLQIKTPGATLSSDVSELHDLWWNAIARAMR
jgi:hypothetical protein